MDRFLAFGAGAPGQPKAYVGWGGTRTPPTHEVEGWFGRVPVPSYTK